MKKTIKTAAILTTAAAVTATAIPFNVFAATPTVTSKYTTEEQAAIRTIFNPTDYAQMYPDVATAFGNDENKLFEHYLVFGIKEGRAPSKTFDVNAYASSYPDLQVAFGDNVDSYILHYATFGVKENRTLTTVKAANNSGYSVYPVSVFKTGVKGVSGASRFSGGAISLTDRGSKSSSSSSASASASGSQSTNGTISFTLDGKKFTNVKSNTDWTHLLYDVYGNDVAYGGNLTNCQLNNKYLFSTDNSIAVSPSKSIQNGATYEWVEAANTVSFTMGNTDYLVKKDTTFEKFCKDKGIALAEDSTGDADLTTTDGEKLKESTTADTTNTYIKAGDTIAKNTYKWVVPVTIGNNTYDIPSDKTYEDYFNNQTIDSYKLSTAYGTDGEEHIIGGESNKYVVLSTKGENDSINAIDADDSVTPGTCFLFETSSIASIKGIGESEEQYVFLNGKDTWSKLDGTNGITATGEETVTKTVDESTYTLKKGNDKVKPTDTFESNATYTWEKNSQE